MNEKTAGCLKKFVEIGEKAKHIQTCFVFSYRTNEMSDYSPFNIFMQQLQKDIYFSNTNNFVTKGVKIGPLEMPAINQWVDFITHQFPKDILSRNNPTLIGITRFPEEQRTELSNFLSKKSNGLPLLISNCISFFLRSRVLHCECRIVSQTENPSENKGASFSSEKFDIEWKYCPTLERELTPMTDILGMKFSLLSKPATKLLQILAILGGRSHVSVLEKILFFLKDFATCPVLLDIDAMDNEEDVQLKKFQKTMQYLKEAETFELIYFKKSEFERNKDFVCFSHDKMHEKSFVSMDKLVRFQMHLDIGCALFSEATARIQKFQQQHQIITKHTETSKFVLKHYFLLNQDVIYVFNNAISQLNTAFELDEIKFIDQSPHGVETLVQMNRGAAKIAYHHYLVEEAIHYVNFSESMCKKYASSIAGFVVQDELFKLSLLFIQIQQARSSALSPKEIESVSEIIDNQLVLHADSLRKYLKVFLFFSFKEIFFLN